MPQSFRRKMISPLPNPRASASAVIFSMAFSDVSPVYGPEFTDLPYSVNAASSDSGVSALSSFGWTTTGFAKPYLVANQSGTYRDHHLKHRFDQLPDRCQSCKDWMTGAAKRIRSD